jgi:hypothetical protein
MVMPMTMAMTAMAAMMRECWGVRRRATTGAGAGSPHPASPPRLAQQAEEEEEVEEEEEEVEEEAVEEAEEEEGERGGRGGRGGWGGGGGGCEAGATSRWWRAASTPPTSPPTTSTSASPCSSAAPRLPGRVGGTFHRVNLQAKQRLMTASMLSLFTTLLCRQNAD